MANKAIFLDRDNTLIEDPGYINSPDQVELLEGTAEALIELKAMGYKLIIITNQSAVARGIVTEKVLGEIHEHLKQLLAEKGAHIDGIYYCPYHPEGSVAKYRKQSNRRKPNPGMLLDAAKEKNIDLGLSWMIGNNDNDVEAGLQAGCKTIRLDHPSQGKQPLFRIAKPDYKAVNMKEAVNIIKKYNRTSSKSSAKTETSQVSKCRKELQSTEETLQTENNQQQQSSEQNISGQRTEQLLTMILEQLKRTQRSDMYNDFSLMRLLAGFLHGLVWFCLLICIWLTLMSSEPRKDNAIFILLGFALVLQVMSLTFYLMQRRK